MSLRNAAALLFAGLFLLSCPKAAVAQTERPRPYPVMPIPPFEEAIERGTRMLTGEPGPAYWTNSAVYEMEASVSPETAMRRGHARAMHVNNSPDELWTRGA